MYVILEEQLIHPIQKMWHEMGKKDVYPTAWNLQKTVWIPKSGQRANQVDKRRGITLLDGGAKGYLVWFQKQMAGNMEENKRGDEYGAVEKRSAGQAILKTLSIRNRLKKNKVSAVTFLGDAVKAFDTIGRETVLTNTDKRIQNEDQSRRLRARHRNIIAWRIHQWTCRLFTVWLKEIEKNICKRICRGAGGN